MKINSISAKTQPPPFRAARWFMYIAFQTAKRDKLTDLIIPSSATELSRKNFFAFLPFSCPWPEPAPTLGSSPVPSWHLFPHQGINSSFLSVLSAPSSSWPLANKHQDLLKLFIPVLSPPGFLCSLCFATFYLLAILVFDLFSVLSVIYFGFFFKHLEPCHVSSSQGVPGCQKESCKIL